MKRYFLSCMLALSYLFCGEPSAFDAGRLDSANPYGLTETEKYIVSTNSKLQNVTKNIASLKTQVDRLSEYQDGAASVLDGINARIASMTKTLQSLENNSNRSIDELKVELDSLRNYVKESRELQISNQENVKKVLVELTSIVDKTNSNYASLEKRVATLENKKPAQTPVNSGVFGNISSEDLMKEGDKLFEAKNYSKAKTYFQELATRKYKPAKNSFMLGEVAYFTENWNEAILHYKKSAELYDKADYMPKLLYHTAISFDKIKDAVNANKFYRLLKANYPNSSEAKASPNR